MQLHLKNLQKLALALSVVVVLNLLFNAAIAAFYAAPEYDDFCREEQRKYYDNKEACEAVGGEWGGPYYPRPVKIVPPPGRETSDEGEPKEYCNPTKTCSKEYESARDLYNRNVFIALVTLGAASVIVAIFAPQGVTAVASGFLYGGLASIFIGTTRYWSDMNEYLRLIALIVILAALVWVGYKKLKDK